MKRDTEIPIENWKTFILLSRIGLETNIYTMIHKIWSGDSFNMPDVWYYAYTHGIISFFQCTMNFDFTDIIKYIILQLHTTKWALWPFPYCQKIKIKHRVRTEIGNQNSRTFPGLFKDHLHFFQESFFIDGNSPNTAYTQDFCPIQDCKRISLSGSLFLPDFISAYCLCTLLSFLPFPISAL